MTTKRFTVGPEFNLHKVITEAEKLAARAVKKGLSGGYTVTTETETVEVPDKSSPLYVEGSTFNPTKPGTITYVVIEGEPVKYNGWAFVAKIEYVNGQPIVTGSPWYEGPAVDRSALQAGYCDHCKTSRARAKTIVVENESGERKQVGSSCVKDFLGSEVNGHWFSDKDPFDALDGYAGSGAVSLENLSYSLAQAACVIRQSGFVPAWKTFEQSTVSVVRLLKGIGTAKYVDEARKQYGLPTAEDEATAARALEYGKTLAGDSEYALNVKAVFAADWFDPKYLGLVVSVVGVLVRDEGTAREKAAAATIIEEQYAPDKTKIEITDATVARIIPVETQWGSSDIVILIGAEHRFKWFTSSTHWLAEGDRIDFKATVKGIDEYNGQTSTTLLRLKVTKTYDAAA